MSTKKLTDKDKGGSSELLTPRQVIRVENAREKLL